MSTGKEVIVTREMVKAFVIEWLFKFGYEWTDYHYVIHHGPTKRLCLELGLLIKESTREPTENMSYGYMYQLTPKAIEYLKEDDRE